MSDVDLDILMMRSIVVQQKRSATFELVRSMVTVHTTSSSTLRSCLFGLPRHYRSHGPTGSAPCDEGQRVVSTQATVATDNSQIFGQITLLMAGTLHREKTAAITSRFEFTGLLESGHRSNDREPLQ